jgi:hypothetical protein
MKIRTGCFLSLNSNHQLGFKLPGKQTPCFATRFRAKDGRSQKHSPVLLFCVGFASHEIFLS